MLPGYVTRPYARAGWADHDVENGLGEATMLVQILQGKVRDPELFAQQAKSVGTELRPNATGWLGATWGVTADNEAIIIARFESAGAADSNSDAAGQAAWSKRLAQLRGAMRQTLATMKSVLERYATRPR